jgi:hypothetical protein
MEENARVRDAQYQAVITGQRRELSCRRRREDGPGPLREGYEPAPGEFDLPLGRMSGHRCDGWRRMTGDEGYFAACSCGWRSAETGHVSLMLSQVDEHLDAVRAVRGGRPSARAARAPGRDEREVGLGAMRPDERTRELYASVESQQARLSQALEHSADLVSASQDQAGRFVAVLEHAAARVAPEWAKTGAALRREQALQRQAECAKEWRNGIAAAAGALAAIAQEVVLAGQDLETRYRSGPADCRRLAANPRTGPAADRLWRDDLRLACGLGRAAD